MKMEVLRVKVMECFCIGDAPGAVDGDGGHGRGLVGRIGDRLNLGSGH